MKNDLNLITELDTLLFTDLDTDAISRPLIWTRFRRHEDNDKRVNCSACNPNINGYVEGQLGCPYCKGYGYLSDQSLIKGYLYKQNEGKDRYNLHAFEKIGKADTTSYVLVTPYDVKPLNEDYIELVDLDSNGKIAMPLKMTERLKVIFNRSMRASTNKTDFNISYLGG